MFKSFRQWLGESDDHIEKHLRAIHRDLEDAGVEYTYIGAMSMRPHNYRRYTEDADILVSKATHPKIEEMMVGRGYVSRPGGKNLNYVHAQPKVPLDVLVEGDMNDGRAMPHPLSIRTMINGVYHPTLPKLIEMKLFTDHKKRPRDRMDVHELIQANKLDHSFAEKLHPDAQSKFHQILKGD